MGKHCFRCAARLFQSIAKNGHVLETPFVIDRPGHSVDATVIPVQPGKLDRLRAERIAEDLAQQVRVDLGFAVGITACQRGRRAGMFGRGPGGSYGAGRRANGPEGAALGLLRKVNRRYHRLGRFSILSECLNRFERPLTMRIGKQLFHAPAASAGEQTQLASIRLPRDLSQHEYGIRTGEPGVFGHTIAPQGYVLPCFSSLAQESTRPTMRLNTSCSGVESGSTQK